MAARNSTRTPKRCTVVGCDKPHEARGWCAVHYQRWLHHGDPFYESRLPRGGGSVGGSGYFQRNGVNEHIRVAEQALGRPLPKGVQVHHVDNNRLNNAGTNLVICRDCSYHRLLHVRTKALDACGNANWRKCKFCRTYDDPIQMYGYPSGGYHHRACMNDYERQRKAKRLSAVQID